MASNTMTIEIQLCEDDRRRLDTILEGIKQIARLQYGIIGEAKAAGTPFTAPATETAPNATETAPAAAEKADSAPEKADSAPQAVVYTLEDVRARVMALSRDGAEKKAKVKAALNKYAESVPALSPDNYADFMADLDALG